MSKRSEVLKRIITDCTPEKLREAIAEVMPAKRRFAQEGGS